MSKYKMLVAIFLGFAAFVAVMIWLSRGGLRPKPEINSFEECVKAGYPVMESYPRQCKLSSGKVFVEQLVPEK